MRRSLPGFVGILLILVRPCGDAPFEVESTGSLAQARASHTSTLLPDGMSSSPAAALPGAPNSTIPPPGVGGPRATWSTATSITPQPCCTMERCWSRAVTLGISLGQG